MLRLDLRPGEGFELDNGRIVVRMESKSGQIARLAIEARKDVPIKRLDVESTSPRGARDGLSKPV